ncbi:CYTH domain-containing protein [uncultured Albimonas sp.]|uniref:CYTH domain-containing protein n=1 Tax=uncultured Albimonas sp. TaxID=1331701 RepID=UPI0030ECF3C1|tara:strand:+ start:321 stop:785 length:465 start_codon:yes stop_codon:yes gene_type:complete
MPREIERKFLVASDSWRRDVASSQRLRDGLLASVEGRKVRVRCLDDRALLTVKGPREGISRDEFEYEIPLADGLALLGHCAGATLEKIRHTVPFGGFEWSVDAYRAPLEDVILAEIELPHEAAEFPRPPWLGREVTGQAEYRKINMLRARSGGG